MKHIDIALSAYYGETEIPGAKSNSVISRFFSRLGFNYGDDTAWCSAFANAVCADAGLPITKQLNARSWLNIGQKVEIPQLGDICVLWRVSPSSWQGHVAFFIRETKDRVYLLGGNQGTSVNISSFPKSQVLGYRRIIS